MMKNQISNKKLKAIVFTDIVNFTKISANDEFQALALIDKQSKILKPIVNKHNGEWLKEIGDGLLLSFDSSLNAVLCSIEIQLELIKVKDLNIRVGIHQGDIFIKDGDVFGDDVNIASRVEGFSPIGGIAISDKINNDIAGIKDVRTSFIGYRKLKGVGQDTKIYCITSNGLPRFRKQWLPYISGIFLMLFGASTIIASIIITFINPNITFAELFKALVRHLSIFIYGYSNLMYVSGVSGKTHRYFVYGSYLIILLYIIGAFTFGAGI